MTDAANRSNVTALPDTSDPVVFRPNGTVLCQVGGRRYVLRRPRMGEFRHLREAMQAMHDRLEDELEVTARRQLQLRSEMAELGGDGGELSDGEQARWSELRREDRRLGRDAAALGDTARLEWLQEAWRLLADQPLPTTEDGALDADVAEAWMLDPNLPAQLLGHWRTVPLASGGR